MNGTPQVLKKRGMKVFNICTQKKCLQLKCELKGGFGCFNILSATFIKELSENVKELSFFVGSNKQTPVDTTDFFSNIQKFGIKFLHSAAYEPTSNWFYTPENLNTIEKIKENAFTNPWVLDEIKQAQKIKEIFQENVENYTTYKTFANNSCFVIIPNPNSNANLQITVEHKELKWIFIVLQEPCQSDLTMLKEIDFKTLDTDMSKFYEFFHKASIHKDIKPDNIVYCNGKFKPIDFGLSKQLPINVQNSKEAIRSGGTDIYISPYLLIYSNPTIETNLKSITCNTQDDDCKVIENLIYMYDEYNVKFLKDPNIPIPETIFTDVGQLINLWNKNQYECLKLFLVKNDEFAYACTLVELFTRKKLINIPEDFDTYLHKLCDASEGLILSEGGYYRKQIGVPGIVGQVNSVVGTGGAVKYKQTSERIMVGKQKRIIYEGPRKNKYIIYKKEFITMSKAKRLHLV